MEQNLLTFFKEQTFLSNLNELQNHLNSPSFSANKKRQKNDEKEENRVTAMFNHQMNHPRLKKSH